MRRISPNVLYLLPTIAMMISGCSERQVSDDTSELPQVLSLTEVQAGNGSLTPLKDGGYVDYKSTIKITPDRAKLQEVVVRYQGGPGAGSLQSATEALKSLNDVAISITTINTLYQQCAVLSVNTPPNAPTANGLVELRQKRAQQEIRLQDALIALVNWRVVQENPGIVEKSKAYTDAVEKLTTPLLTLPTVAPPGGPPPAAQGGPYNLDPILDFLRATGARISAQALAATANATLDIAAFRQAAGAKDSQRVPIGVSPYSKTIGDDTLVQVPRFAMPNDPRTAAQIKADEDVYNGLSAALNDLIDSAKRNAPDSKWKDIVDELRGLTNPDKVQKLISDLRTGLNAYLATSADPLVANLRDKLIPPVLKDLNAAEASFALITNPNSSASAIVAELQKLVTTAETLRTDILAVGAAIDAAGTAGLAGPAKQALDALKTVVAAYLTMNLPVLANLVAKAQVAIGLRYDQALAGVGVVTAIAYPQKIGSATTGSLDLKSHLNPGDQLIVTTTLHAGAVDESHDFKFEGRKKGFYINSDAELMILARRNSDTGKRELSSAVAVTVNGHYRRYDSNSDFWEYFNPGIGISMATIQSNNRVGFGLGGHFSLFNDVLQMGAGYDLSATSHPGYVYLGIGLISGFQQFTTPPSSH